MEGLRDELSEVSEIVKRVYSDHEKEYCPVGDICHVLFFVEPPNGVPRMRSADEQRLQQLIEDVNKQLNRLSRAQLAEIDHIRVVAGRRRKAPAIAQVLRDFNVRVLCTDARVGEALANWGSSYC